MNSRDIFLRDLRNELSDLSLLEQEEIIDDYLTTFEEKSSQGLSDEDIIRELGNPQDIAKDFLSELKVERKEEPINDRFSKHENSPTNTQQNVGLGIAFLVFDVLLGFWIYLSVLVILCALICVGIAIMIMPYSSFLFVNFDINFTFIVVCFLLFGIGLLMISLVSKLFRFIIELGKTHIRWVKGLFGGAY